MSNGDQFPTPPEQQPQNPVNPYQQQPQYPTYPMQGQPYPPQPAPTYGYSAPQPPAQGGNNRRILIIVGSVLGVLVLACCACVGFASLINRSNGASSVATNRSNGTVSATGNSANANNASNNSAMVFDRTNWALLDSNPDNYKGAKVDIVGKVFVEPEKDEQGTYWQMYCDPKNSEWNTVVQYGEPNFALKQGDYVHVVGTVRGTFEGTNAFGATLKLPLISATSATIADATAAASPPIRTADVQASQSQHSIKVTVSKVEFAADETRVFVTVKNGSQYKVSFYSFEAKAVQGNTQYDPAFASDYPEVQSDILPGIQSSGVLSFPPADPGKALTLVFELSADNYSWDFKPYTFTVKP